MTEIPVGVSDGEAAAAITWLLGFATQGADLSYPDPNGVAVRVAAAMGEKNRALKNACFWNWADFARAVIDIDARTPDDLSFDDLLGWLFLFRQDMVRASNDPRAVIKPWSRVLPHDGWLWDAAGWSPARATQLLRERPQDRPTRAALRAAAQRNGRILPFPTAPDAAAAPVAAADPAAVSAPVAELDRLLTPRGDAGTLPHLDTVTSRAVTAIVGARNMRILTQKRFDWAHIPHLNTYVTARFGQPLSLPDLLGWLVTTRLTRRGQTASFTVAHRMEKVAHTARAHDAWLWVAAGYSPAEIESNDLPHQTRTHLRTLAAMRGRRIPARVR